MTSTYDYDLVAIGSGPAGQRAAVQAAKLGRRAAVIEKRRCVGGVCIDTGTIPSKTIREAILAYAGGSTRGDRLPWARPASRPSAAQLLAGVEAVIGREIEVIEQQLRRNDVTLIQGEASFLDPNTLAIRAATGISKVSAHHIVIAVGTHPAPTPGVEPDGEIVLNSDQIVNLKTLPRSMAVVGAGVIGIEYASMFAAVGVQVTLVERRDRPPSSASATSRSGSAKPWSRWPSPSRHRSARCSTSSPASASSPTRCSSRSGGSRPPTASISRRRVCRRTTAAG